MPEYVCNANSGQSLRPAKSLLDRLSALEAPDLAWSADLTYIDTH